MHFKILFYCFIPFLNTSSIQWLRLWWLYIFSAINNCKVHLSINLWLTKLVTDRFNLSISQRDCVVFFYSQFYSLLCCSMSQFYSYLNSDIYKCIQNMYKTVIKDTNHSFTFILSPSPSYTSFGVYSNVGCKIEVQLSPICTEYMYDVFSLFYMKLYPLVRSRLYRAGHGNLIDIRIKFKTSYYLDIYFL